jgi:hypothetical protein
VEHAADHADRLATDPLALPSEIVTQLTELLATLEAKPDQSTTSAARAS